MLDAHDSAPSEPSTAVDVELESLTSAALTRLIDEVSNPTDPTQVSSTNYNRTYHRHNR